MAIDARFVTAEQLDTDICIVGSGPAGITLAREFIGDKTKVTILESGQIEFDPQTQQLAAGATIGDPLIAPYDALNRQFGGLSNRWVLKIGAKQIGVRYALFDDIDYQQRSGIPYSGWPFSRQALTPFFERAQQVCKIGPYRYDPGYWLDDPETELPFDTENIETGMFQFGRRNAFYQDYRQELEHAANITIYHYANAVEIRTDDNGKSATQVRVACLNGNRFWVNAKVVVLACGAFENARILLMSNKQQAAGLGNQHDVVGRYFHDHPAAISGYFTPADKTDFDRAGIYDLRRVNDVAVQGYLRLSKSVLERENLANINSLLFPCPNERQTRALKAFKSLGENTWSLLKNLKATSNNARKRTIPSKFYRQLLTDSLHICCGLDAVFKATYLWLFKQQSLFPQFGSGGGWSLLKNNSRRFQRFEVRHSLEQLPHPDNRVKLSSDIDALGCPKLEVHWHWRPADADNLTRYVKLLAEEIASNGLGQFDYQLNEQGEIDLVKPSGSHHLMGTTRMHDDPKFGVVNANCQVHGINNLYVAGSSTFPTGGYANPTLTIVAMALRLADHIKQNMASSTAE